MSLRIGATITNGLGRVANRNGVVLILASVLAGVGWQIAVNSVFGRFLPSEMSGSLGPAVDAPLAVLVVAGIATFLLLSYVSVVAMRTFVAGASRSIPREFLTRRIPWVIANVLVGGIAYGFLTFVGTLLLVVPGVIVYVALLFTALIVAVDDADFVTAMQRSWGLTRGNWLHLFLLLLVVILPVTVVLTVLSVGVSVAFEGSTAASQLLSAAISMPVSVLLLGVLAEAFVRLREEAEAAGDAADAEPAGGAATR